MSEALRRLWAERSASERAVITVATTLVVLALAYAYVWLPVAHERNRLLDRVPKLRAEALALERDARDIERLTASTPPRPLNLKAAIEQASTASGIATGTVTLRSPESAGVSIASARAEQALAWVARLPQYGIRVENMQVHPLGDQGIVRIDALLRSR